MNRRALHPDQALDALGFAEEAISKVRAIIECAPNVGPVLVQGYLCMSALGRLREVIDSLPIVREEPQ